MPDEPAEHATPDAPEKADQNPPETEPPDGSTLLGATGVEQEVLAELARAEGELNDPDAPDEGPDEEGSEV